jgi:HD-like signal output (HDOD) protein
MTTETESELLARTSADLQVVDSRGPAMLERIAEAVRAGELRTPLLPARALELLQLTNAREVSFDALARQAVQDPVAAMTVMRMANSAAFAPASRPIDIKDALVRIGIDGVRQVAYDIAMSSRIARRGRFLPILVRILRHGQTTSALARILARELGIPAGPAALAGLLHAAGGMVIVDELAGQRNQRTVSDVVVFIMVRRLHPWVGSQVVGRLGLDDSVVDAIRTHHDGMIPERSLLSRLLTFVDLISPSEPATRVVPLQLALERSGLPLSTQTVLRRLQPIISTVEDVRLSRLGTV